MKIIIVGGVAGGASAAARLRRLDENAQIIMFEKGDYISFANCGLPYYIGGEITEKSKLTLQTPQSFNARFNVDVRVKQEVIAIDKENHFVKVKNLFTQEIYTESYDKLILSPGAKPIIPKINGADSDNVFILRNIPDTYKISDFLKNHSPKTAAIIGGGFIGIEMAENLTHKGVKVTIYEAAPHIATVLDEDTACDLSLYLEEKGVTIKTEYSVADIAQLNADMVIMSVGVTPDAEIAKSAGLDTNAKGAILVDEHMLTSDKDIYAVGDAVQIKNFITGDNGYVPLAGPANKQGRIAADNICGFNSVYTGTQGTSILKAFDMTAAATGLNERAAKQAGLNYDKVFLWSNSHATYYPGATNMSLKVIFEKETGKILGAQAVGFDGVDKRIDVLATAIRAGMNGFDLCNLELAYAPPFSSAKDPVNMAGFMIENLLTDKIEQYHWHDIAQIAKKSDVTMLDVRMEKEYSACRIEGTVNIPLDEIRARINELSKEKPIYVNCQSGLRSYIACRILKQNGFKVYNLAGGYRLYSSVKKFKDLKNNTTHACGLEL